MLGRHSEHTMIAQKFAQLATSRKARLFHALREIVKRLEYQKTAEKRFSHTRSKIIYRGFINGLRLSLTKSKESARLTAVANTGLRRSLLRKSFAGLRKLIEPGNSTIALAESKAKQQIRIARKRLVKTHTFSVWKGRSLRRMQRAKSTVLMARGLQRLILQLWFARYRNETSFFRELDARVQQGKALVRRQKVRHALARMADAVQSHRHALENALRARQKYVGRKLSLAFDSWKMYTIRRFQDRSKVMQIRELRQKRLVSRAIGGWTVHHKLCQIKKQMRDLATGFQIRHGCRPFWATWWTATVGKVQERSMQAKADNNYVECLLVKGFVSLKNEAKKQRLKRQNEEKAELLCDIMRMRRSMAGMKAHAKEEAARRLRHQAFAKLMAKVFQRRDKAAALSSIRRWSEYAKKVKTISTRLSRLSVLVASKVLHDPAHPRIDRENGPSRTGSVHPEEIGEHRQSAEGTAIPYEGRVRPGLQDMEGPSLPRPPAPNFALGFPGGTQGQGSASVFSVRGRESRFTAKWRETTLIDKRTRVIAEQIRRLRVARVQQRCWAGWKEAYVEEVEEKERNLSADQHYRETLKVKGFVALKSHAKDSRLSQERTIKAAEFYSLLLRKKYFAFLQQNSAVAKARSMHRFELSRRIAQIDQHNLLDSAFHAMYSFHLAKKRLVAGYTILAKKHTPRVQRFFLRRWVEAVRAIAEAKKSEDQRRMESAGKHSRLRVMGKAFAGLRGVATEGIRRMRREKLHSVFTAWRVQAREKALLKGYLKQCHIDEKYALTPIATYRYDVPTIKGADATGISPASSEDPLSQRMNSPMTISVGSSAVSAGKSGQLPESKRSQLHN